MAFPSFYKSHHCIESYIFIVINLSYPGNGLSLSLESAETIKITQLKSVSKCSNDLLKKLCIQINLVLAMTPKIRHKLS